ncbi:MAG: hypothetical protein WAW63_05980 [Candidatus Saccharimonadales bacterium]|nr:hypothetical protein [Candidatus Saccharibacteria bacterium]
MAYNNFKEQVRGRAAEALSQRRPGLPVSGEFPERIPRAGVARLGPREEVTENVWTIPSPEERAARAICLLKPCAAEIKRIVSVTAEVWEDYGVFAAAGLKGRFRGVAVARYDWVQITAPTTRGSSPHGERRRMYALGFSAEGVLRKVQSLDQSTYLHTCRLGRSADDGKILTGMFDEPEGAVEVYKEHLLECTTKIVSGSGIIDKPLRFWEGQEAVKRKGFDLTTQRLGIPILLMQNVVDLNFRREY